MQIGRKHLPHTPPPSLVIGQEDEVYFITICCQPRGYHQLTQATVWAAIQESSEHRQKLGQWKIRLILAMPDHLHLLASFPSKQPMEKTIRHFKSWLAKQHSIQWQDGFFDHRLRSWESAVEKRKYILNNPLRAGLVTKVEDWPFWWEPGK